MGRDVRTPLATTTTRAREEVDQQLNVSAYGKLPFVQGVKLPMGLGMSVVRIENQIVIVL